MAESNSKPVTGSNVICDKRASSTIVCRIMQNFILVWLDANIDQSKEDFNNSLNRLRTIVPSVFTYTKVEECLQFIKKTEDEKIFLILSGSLGKTVISQIESLTQVDSIYVFCSNKIQNDQWAKNIQKVKGIYTDIGHICDALYIDRRRCDQTLIPISYNGVDALFMYTQLLKGALLQIEDDDEQSIKDLVEYCRTTKDIPEKQIQLIEREYRSHTPIWWYTSPYFIYSTLNRGLREMNCEIILKLGFFIRHLHNDIAECYRKQQEHAKTQGTFLTLYRGQGLTKDSFDKMRKSKGGLMSFNNFLSTSRNYDISFEQFTISAVEFNPDILGVLFVMKIDVELCQKQNIPFVDVSKVGFFEDSEAEILFTTHTIFRIERITSIPHKQYQGRLWEVRLSLAAINDKSKMSELTANFNENLVGHRGWHRLGEIFIRVGEPAKAERLFQLLLDKANTDDDKAVYYGQLANIYDDTGNYGKAIQYYENTLKIHRNSLKSDDPRLATSYNNIGNVYHKTGEYSKALQSYEQSLEIKKIALPPKHPDLAGNYNNIGNVYYNMGEYSKALESYEKSLEIRKTTLPPNHPDLGASYNNIAVVYDNIGKYSEALKSYQRSLEIRKVALPPTHPDLAASHNNIGNAYQNMGEYSKALESYERSLEIDKKVLPPNHPDIACDYNNIGIAHRKMNEYSKALESYERSLEIRKIALPPNHPDLANSYSNIGLVYESLGNNSKALVCFEEALAIREKSLPVNNSLITKLKGHIDSIKAKL